MLEKLFAFLKRLFGIKDTSTTTKTVDFKALPKIDPDDPQDGSDIGADTLEVETIEELVAIEEMIKEEAKADPPEIDLPPVVVTPGETENESVAESHKPRYLWCLDNGHGKKTAGKRSPTLADGRQFFEYEFNRDIVKRMMSRLEQLGVQFFNVVPEVDVDNFLIDRVKRANAKKSSIPKLYLSIHANAAPALPGKWSAPHISGIETWYFHNNRRGKKLAAIFQKHLIKATSWKNRHIKSRPTKQFYVLKKTSMTAILTENGFYNNEKECLELLKPEVRQKIADAHVDAIMEIEEKGI